LRTDPDECERADAGGFEEAWIREPVTAAWEPNAASRMRHEKRT
jgi:hypothetical protein